MKTCNTCNESKSLSEFHTFSDNRTGKVKHRAKCKSCLNEYARKQLAEKRKNPEFRKFDRDRTRYWREDNPDRFRLTRLKASAKEKGLDFAIVYEYYLSHKGACDICGDDSLKRALAVDHCHATGKFRGLLCSTCNTGLGHFKDSPVLLAEAIAYLAR